MLNTDQVHLIIQRLKLTLPRFLYFSLNLHNLALVIKQRKQATFSFLTQQYVPSVSVYYFFTLTGYK